MTKLPPPLPPTEKQITLLERWGLKIPVTRREASKEISDEIECRKQIRYYEVPNSRLDDEDDWDNIDDYYGSGGDYDPGGNYD